MEAAHERLEVHLDAKAASQMDVLTRIAVEVVGDNPNVQRC